MRLPDFLIIGAMKAGTTTLYRDLMCHPGVFLPEDKEPGCLCHDRVLSQQGRAEYAAHYLNAEADQCCCDATTEMSKLPDVPGSPDRALTVIGPDLKLIYLIRNPIDRAISHHRHDFSRGEMPRNFDKAVDSHPELVNYSRYAMQASAWLELFPQKNFLFLIFEEFIADRMATFHQCVSLLGLPPITQPQLEIERVYNASSDTVLLKKGILKKLNEHPFYRRVVRPWIPPDARLGIQRLLLPKAPPKPPPPSRDTINKIVDELRDDLDSLKSLLGRDALPWNLEETAAKYK